jgi:phosphatidylserine/phosphatidylglycerophosphate/cardiolipin synthase-like enzyme
LIRPTFVVMEHTMLAMSSTNDVLAALQHAHKISLLAYTLRPGRIEQALIEAAKRGAHVTVRLQGQLYADPNGAIADDNRKATAALQAAGVDAQLVNSAGSSGAPLHAKAILADRSIFLDDRNWPDDDADTILRDDFSRDRQMVADAVRDRGDRPDACFTIRKRDSLASEARLLQHAQLGDDVIVESESFGFGNRVYAALDKLGKSGASPRVLVSARDLHGNVKERSAIARLVHDGVRVRACDGDEKFALAGTRGWLGSTNATVAFNHPDQLDWGMRTDDSAIAAHMRERFEARWDTSTTAVVACAHEYHDAPLPAIRS